MAEVLTDGRLDFTKYGKEISGTWVPKQPPKVRRVAERPTMCVLCWQPVSICCGKSIFSEDGDCVAGRR